MIVEVLMRAPKANWMNDDPWAMGVLERFFLLLFIALIVYSFDWSGSGAHLNGLAARNRRL